MAYRQGCQLNTPGEEKDATANEKGVEVLARCKGRIDFATRTGVEQMWPVSRKMNRVGNDNDPTLIDALQ